MNLLKRELAPITPEAWSEIDEEATRVLKLHLAARKIVDFVGPLGWECASINTGRLESISEPMPSVSARMRVVQPLVELRVPFQLAIAELDDISRGAKDVELDPLIDAAKRIALAEDHAVFNGMATAKINGLLPSTEHPPVAFGRAAELPTAVIAAREALRRVGVGGPFALALSPSLYDEFEAAVENGYPIRQRVKAFVDKIIWAPALDHGALISMRGGDLELTVGQDLSIGYSGTNGDSVQLYLTESFTFRAHETTVVVPLQRQA